MPVIACGNIRAAAAPCRTRAATSAPASGASPASSEVTANEAIPSRNIRRYPRAWPSRAPVISSVA